MKISEVTIQDIKDYARIEHSEDDPLFNIILDSIKSHILSYTGLDAESVDAKEDLTMALLVLSNEMYENRVYTVKDNKVNAVVESILNKHCINLL